MNYYKEILDYIEGISKKEYGYEKIAPFDILFHLIEIMGKDDFNLKFPAYFLENENETFDGQFFMFHKHMRQIDFFNEHYRRIDPPCKSIKGRPEYDSIGGHLDMIFWNFIQMSDVPYTVFKSFHEQIKKTEENEIHTKN
jgi:hypothetical protein